jgi:hypothetical protein
VGTHLAKNLPVVLARLAYNGSWDERLGMISTTYAPRGKNGTLSKAAPWYPMNTSTVCNNDTVSAKDRPENSTYNKMETGLSHSRCVHKHFWSVLYLFYCHVWYCGQLCHKLFLIQ